MPDKTLFSDIEKFISEDQNYNNSNNIILSDDEKIEEIEKYFKKIFITLGLNLNDSSIKETPKRVAKMYVNEFFYGLSPENFPKLTFIPNRYKHNNQMVLNRNVLVQSICEHHLLPMSGIAHVAYIPKDKIIGLSKINRIVDYFSKRPQLQEKLTHQICNCISHVLGTNDVAVSLELTHFCMQFRGIKDPESKTITSQYLGRFNSDKSLKNEFCVKISR